VEGLGKRYKIGTRTRYWTLRDQISERLRSAFRKPGRGRSTPDQYIWALDDLNFEVSQGQVVGVIGRNGAGKSTLLKILSRITEPTKGFADIDGRVGSLLEVGTGFHPELTGRENIFLNGAILGMKRAEIQRKFDAIVAFSEVEKFIDTPVKHYSSGMYLRLAFAVAAHLETEILLVDELLAVGDAAFQKRCLGKMGEVANSGRTILLVSHNMPVISALAERSILIQEGKVALYDDTENVIRTYLASGKQMAASLTTHTERTGTGELRFTALEICGESGERLPFLISGQSATIRLHYTCERPVRSGNLIIDMLICDSLGFPVCTFSTRFAPLEEQTLAAQGALECYIPQLLLAEESYSANIWCVLNNTLVDFIQNVGLPPVQSYDFFGTGAMPIKRKHGSLLLPHQWRPAHDLALIAHTPACR
jgi:lipopolysaccharide transport system ATP-binding protein